MTQSNDALVPLGRFIIQCDERNSDNRYTVDDVRGISINKTIIDTKANMDGVPLTSYKLFKPNQFCYVPVTSRNGNKITLAINDTDKTFIVSATYVVFRVADESVLEPLFLFLWFCRSEFDRYARFNSWGSARESFSYAEMERVEILIPDIDEQRKLVATWKHLKAVKEENEALAAPLFQLCQSKIQELKRQYPLKSIAPYIEERNERNSDDTIKRVLGVSTEKEFREAQSRVDTAKLSSYKIVRHHDFVFVPTTDTWRCLAICLSNEERPFVVSPIYCVFRMDESVILPDFFHLWCKRKEFDRYARFHSWGSARENFNFSEMKEVKIPIPPINIQRAIVDIYLCAKEAKRIADEADKMSHDICPALMQKAINT